MVDPYQTNPEEGVDLTTMENQSLSLPPRDMTVTEKLAAIRDVQTTPEMPLLPETEATRLMSRISANPKMEWPNRQESENPNLLRAEIPLKKENLATAIAESLTELWNAMREVLRSPEIQTVFLLLILATVMTIAAK
jgi:hypothetical protein